jgi:hypothetical protein
VAQTVRKFTLKIVKEVIRLISRIRLKVVQELVSQISILSQHIVQVSQPFLPRFTLIIDLLVHLIALVVNIGHDLLLVRDTRLFLLDQPILDALKLSAHRVQVVIMVLYTVFALLVKHFFEVIPDKQPTVITQISPNDLHSLVVV